MSEPLAGRGAVVVGGSRGIGLAVAELLAAQGAGVVVNGRDADAVGEAVARMGGGAVGFPGSPADPAVADALIDSCIGEFGRIDILVNCAGTAEPAGSSILNVTSGQFRDLLDAHLGTVFETCRAAAPKMVAQGGGAIVNTSSFAFLGDYGGTGYPAGKGGGQRADTGDRRRAESQGVRANVVCPGARTRMSTGPDYEAQIAELIAGDCSTTSACRARSTRRRPSTSRRPTRTWSAISPKTSRARSSSPQAVSSVVSSGRRRASSPTAIMHDSPPWSIDELDGFIHRG